MKKRKLFVILLAAIMATTSSVSLCACNTSGGDNNDSTGNTSDIGNAGNTGDNGDNGDTGDNGDNGDSGNSDDTDDLGTVLAKYTDVSKWNFAVNYQEGENGEVDYDDYYEYNGKNIKYVYDRYDDYENYLGEATDYLGYDNTQKAYYLYWDNLDNTYSKYKESTTDFYNYYYLYDLDLTTLSDYAFNEVNGVYEAAKPNDVGNTVVGEFTSYTWIKFTIKIENGKITQIEGTQNDGYVMRFIFSKYGSINFTLPDEDTSGGKPTEPTGTMEKQTYDAATFDKERLQDKLGSKDVDGAIGLPSTGTYHALIIPVHFDGDKTISDEQLTKLNLAFNGTSEDTGWESVNSYYKTASYGALDITFDIQPVVELSGNAEHYESYKEEYTENGETYTRTGEELVLTEALDACDNSINFNDYDYNGDGCIDAVYLIYSAPVDYQNADFYWAYVTWYYGENQYDGKDAFYYMFTGFDFMDEDLDKFDGMTINAETYIHETGHLLGLDDYYDYDENSGCNEGLGGADMMDYNKGDHGVYSKMMLGWLTPQIVTSTQTITIKSSQAQGDAILIPLDFNNSYFCEYLLIDLYSAEGLNEIASKMDKTPFFTAELLAE